MVLAKRTHIRIVVHTALLLVVFMAAFMMVASRVSAAPAAENRPPSNTAETNARDRCISEDWQAIRYGAIWVTNRGYYSEGVVVNATANTVSVAIAGSVYGCHNTSTNNTYAVNISPQGPNGWRLTGLSSTSLFRGQSQGSHNWSTQGGTVNATLNVSGLATNNVGRTDTQTITIDLYRCFSTNSSSPTGACYPETVPITVIREARPAAATCSISASPSSYVSGGTNTTTITWSSTNATSMTVERGSTTLSTALNGSYTDNQSSSATYTGAVNGPGGSGSCSTNVVVYPPPGCTTSPAIAAVNAPVTFTATQGDSTKTYNWSSGYVGNPYVTSYPTPGQYTVTVTNGGVSASCSVTVVNEPYHRVFGGDTLAGVGFAASDTTCPASSVSNGKRQLGFVRQVGGNYTGGGNSHANIATGAIVEFVSGMLEPGPSNPRAFAFANMSGGFGGSLNMSNLATACAADYYGQLPGSSTAVSSPSNVPASDGNYTFSGNFKLNGSTVPAGKRVTLYVNGDVFISGNITYANSSAYSPNPTQIPSFKLIVRGNIYVGANVTELNGVYIAQPNGASGGTFYTCGFDRGGRFEGPKITAPGNPAESSEFVNECAAQPLSIYGAVVAKTVQLHRSRGTLPTTTEGFPSNAAEKFIYTPDVWFNGDPSTSKPFQSYTALPPLL